MINLREHFKLSAIYTFFAAFPALLQLIVYPVIEGEARLGATDFGYLAITEAIVSVVFLICTFGMGAGIARFYHDHPGKSAGYGHLVSSILTGIIGRGLLLLGVVFIMAPRIGQLFPHEALQDFGRYGPSLVIAGLNRSVIATLLVLYRNEKRVRAFVIVSIFSGILRSGFQVAGVFLYDLSFIGYVYGTALGGTFVAVALVVYTYTSCGVHYKRPLLHSLHRFAAPLFLTEFIYWGLLFGDRFFLLNNTEELGIYDNAMKFAIGVQMIIQGLTAAAQPEIYRYMKEGFTKREAEIKTVSSLFIAESAGIIALAIIPVMLFINIFYETELTMSAGLVGIVFVRFMLRAQYQVFSWPLLYRKKSLVFFLINSVVLVINLGLNWLLTPRVGYYGAVTAFMTAFVIQIVLLRIVQHRKAPVSYNSMKVFWFPLSIIMVAALSEVVKVLFSLNPYFSAVFLVFYILGGLAVIYRAEIQRVLSRII